MSARVGLLPLAVAHGVLDHAHREAQEAEEPSHPLAVALGQIVVHRDDVDALPLEGVQVGRQGRHQGLALAGLHLGDRPPVEGDAADELDVEVPHVEDAAPGLAHDGEGLGKEVVEGASPASPRRRRNSAVLSFSCVVASGPGGRLQLADPCMRGRIRLISRSFLVPMILVRMVLIIGEGRLACAARQAEGTGHDPNRISARFRAGQTTRAQPVAASRPTPRRPVSAASSSRRTGTRRG